MILTFATVAAMADVPPRPRIEPGPIQKIDQKAVATMDAMMMAKSADLKKFMMAGNTINAATMQALAPGVTNYTVTRQNCTTGGIVGDQCLGGAQLEIMITIKRSGEQVEKSAVSRVTVLR